MRPCEQQEGRTARAVTRPQSSTIFARSQFAFTRRIHRSRGADSSFADCLVCRVGAGRPVRDRPYPLSRTVHARFRAHGSPLRLDTQVRGFGAASAHPTFSMPCHDQPVYVLDRTGAALLPLAEQRLNPLVALLRRLPLGHMLMPELQVVRWGAFATYRVQLLAAPATMCDPTPCTGCCCWMPHCRVLATTALARYVPRSTKVWAV
jgi:hypothetical protein